MTQVIFRHFFVGVEPGAVYLGYAPAQMEVVHEELQHPVGLAFFCPICAEVWARALIDGQPTQVRHRACEKHSNATRHGYSSLGIIFASDIPGSLFLAESRAWNDTLPPSVIARELRLTLAWAADADHLQNGVASMAGDMLRLMFPHRRSA